MPSASDISANAVQAGNAGNIHINARGAVSLNNGQISAALNSTPNSDSAPRRGGIIRISADTISLSNRSQIGAFASRRGSAGTILLQAQERVSIDNSILSTFLNTTTGQGGDMQIRADSLWLTNGGLLLLNSGGQGNAGTANIQVHDRVIIDSGSSNRLTGIGSSTISNTVGEGGDTALFRFVRYSGRGEAPPAVPHKPYFT